ncbi:MAG TPA: hypothetical protein PKZ22_08275 [Accumulibacter sp.]|jgi:hypothetical protein|nr:hypothetical protein [Accumulibacter sp.]
MISKQSAAEKPAEDSGKIIVFRVLLWIMAAFISAAALLLAVGGILNIVGAYYDMHHAIPDPIERGKDLGAGLVAMATAVIAFAFSLLLFFPLTKFLFCILRKLLGVTSE